VSTITNNNTETKQEENQEEHFVVKEKGKPEHRTNESELKLERKTQ
jgi:hypothetical protein